MATLQDRFNINSQLEHLQAKYVGTGHADLQRFEWAGELQPTWQLLRHTCNSLCSLAFATANAARMVAYIVQRHA